MGELFPYYFGHMLNDYWGTLCMVRDGATILGTDLNDSNNFSLNLVYVLENHWVCQVFNFESSNCIKWGIGNKGGCRVLIPCSSKLSTWIEFDAVHKFICENLLKFQ